MVGNPFRTIVGNRSGFSCVRVLCRVLPTHKGFSQFTYRLKATVPLGGFYGCSITLSAHGGGVGAKTGLYYTPEGKVRKLVPREAARLMGFPDTFIPHPSTSQALQHFGNAVVVDVVEKIGKNILHVLQQN